MCTFVQGRSFHKCPHYWVFLTGISFNIYFYFYLCHFGVITIQLHCTRFDRVKHASKMVWAFYKQEVLALWQGSLFVCLSRADALYRATIESENMQRGNCAAFWPSLTWVHVRLLLWSQWSKHKFIFNFASHTLGISTMTSMKRHCCSVFTINTFQYMVQQA